MGNLKNTDINFHEWFIFLNYIKTIISPSSIIITLTRIVIYKYTEDVVKHKIQAGLSEWLRS